MTERLNCVDDVFDALFVRTIAAESVSINVVFNDDKVVEVLRVCERLL